MRIGVITFWNSQDNYGQLLQCFALQNYLKKAGHNAFLIRYFPRTKNKTKFEKILSVRKILSPKYVKAYIELQRNKEKSKKFDTVHPRFFDKFRSKYLSMSDDSFYSFQELKDYHWDNVDAFICGSDQIWSYSPMKDNVDAFFLQFAPANIVRIAYAASFGRAQLPPDYSDRLPKLLDNFKAVSVREKSGIKICKEALRPDVKLVCDPTFLLEGDFYTKTICDLDITPTNSIFIYLINWETEFPLSEIKSFLNDNELKTSFFGAHGMEYKNMFESEKNLTIESWINSMASSKYVFTNSFHGTALAILLKKPFISFPLLGQSAAMNGRLITLLERLGLQNRLYHKDTTIENIISFPIDWKLVDEKINEFRQESIEFLNNALKN